VVEKIKKGGDIFLAWSDRKWIVDGAQVHVSIVGFDDGSEKVHMHNGRSAKAINADSDSRVGRDKSTTTRREPWDRLHGRHEGRKL